MQRKASRAGRRVSDSLSCSGSPPVTAKAAAGCTHCCFGVTHAMRSRHQRSRAENVPQSTALLKRNCGVYCDFRVEDGDCLWMALENCDETTVQVDTAQTCHLPLRTATQ